MQALQSLPDPLLTVHVAQWRILSEIGLSPRLDCCVQCGRTQDAFHYFSIRSCGLVCGRSECLARAPDVQQLSGGALACLAYCQSALLPRLFNFTLQTDVRNQVIDLSARYLVHQLEKPYSKLDMLKTLQSG
jgi:recombinational DNA repair protein (RecF pathway)